MANAKGGGKKATHNEGKAGEAITCHFRHAPA